MQQVKRRLSPYVGIFGESKYFRPEFMSDPKFRAEEKCMRFADNLHALFVGITHDLCKESVPTLPLTITLILREDNTGYQIQGDISAHPLPSIDNS